MSNAPLAERRGVVGVILLDSQFLVIRRSEHVVAPLAYCFPGGGIEPGESETDALARELFEELALKATPRCRLWSSVTPWGVSLAWWHCRIDDGAAIVPNPREVASLHWCSAAAMRSLPGLLKSNLDFLDALDRGVFTLD